MDLRKRSERDGRGGRDERGDAAATVVARSVWSAALLYVVFALVGAGAGYLVGLLADWFVTLPWAPMQGPARLVSSVPGPWLSVGGAVLGLVVAGVAQYEQLAVRVSDARVVLTGRGREQEFAGGDIDTVFRDGGRLVLLGRDGGELAREKCDLDGRRLAGAFTGHGYAWADADPLQDAFRRWVPGEPELPEGANALLTARQRYLEKHGSSNGDVRELRGELARLGVVVRDEKRRQYWRTRARAQ